MHKQLILAGMAFAAFVVVPAASASPVLTSGGIKVAVGTSVTGTNTGVAKFTAGGFTVECDHDHLVGTITQNTGTQIKAEVAAGSAKFNGTGTSTDCTSNLGSTKVIFTSKLCLETVAGTDTYKITGCGASLTFDLEVTGTGQCAYTTASMFGTFNTIADATVNLPGQVAKKKSGGIFCPSEELLDVDFDLYETGDSEPLHIS